MTGYKLNLPDYTENKRIVAAIVQENGGEFRNKTNLFKAYYWAHRFFYEDHEGLLTRKHRMVHLPMGPGIDEHDLIFGEMVDEGSLEVLSNPFKNRDGKDCAQFVFRSVGPNVELTADERDSISRGIARVRSMTAADASHDSHENSRTWRDSNNGEPIDIYVDTLDDDEFEEATRSLGEAEAEVQAALRAARREG